GLPREQQLSLAPLTADLAARLFLERARAADPSLQASDDDARAICDRLDRLPLALALGRFFDIRGWWQEGRRWLTRFDPPGAPPALLGRALNLAGVAAFRTGDF